MNLLPCPRVLRREAGSFTVPRRSMLRLDSADPAALAAARRLQAGAVDAGIDLAFASSDHATAPESLRTFPVSVQFKRAPQKDPAGRYFLRIDTRGVRIESACSDGWFAAVATLRQLLREHGRRLPHVMIEDWPDFSRRGVLLDVSRGRVPRLETLLELVDQLADFKINEFQLYIEHTFAYRNYRPVWRGWGALTGLEIRKLDARCRELGIDLVPNQNSFGHLRQWLAYRPLKELAEVSRPYESEDGDFVRFPSTLAPGHSRVLPFLRGLYDELLPNFSSRFFNVGCDETWDLGRGQSRALCERKGKGRVYLDFLKAIHREVSARGRTTMFWGDMILRYPEQIHALPRNMIALNWGYEADHPFDRETAAFAKAGLRFYVCPGTSTWMTLIGRHDNALANLRSAAVAGRKRVALGYLIADWGDGGHPQPLAVSYLPYLAGAALSWCARSFDEGLLVPVLNRDVFHDSSGRLGEAARALGFAHTRFRRGEPNGTPFGTTLAAPPRGARELFCRNGLKNYRQLAGKNVAGALEEVETQLAEIRRSRPSTPLARRLRLELELAARMAAQSCHFILWQQAVAEGRSSAARRLSQIGIRALRELDRDFRSQWPSRNKGTPSKCAAFLKWRIADYEGSESKPGSKSTTLRIQKYEHRGDPKGD